MLSSTFHPQYTTYRLYDTVLIGYKLRHLILRLFLLAFSSLKLLFVSVKRIRYCEYCISYVNSDVVPSTSQYPIRNVISCIFKFRISAEKVSSTSDTKQSKKRPEVSVYWSHLKYNLVTSSITWSHLGHLPLLLPGGGRERRRRRDGAVARAGRGQRRHGRRQRKVPGTRGLRGQVPPQGCVSHFHA